jgi:anti-sigma-K factor RskA
VNPVNPAVNDRDDQYYEELLGAAAFGTLTAEEEAELQAYLKTSETARAELAELRALAGDLTLLADEMDPPPDLRNRIEQAVLADVTWGADVQGRPRGDEPKPLDFEPKPSRKPIPLWRNYIWAAAAALLIAVLAGAVLDRVFFQDDDDPVDNRQTIAFDLSLATPAPGLTAELTYDPDQHLFVLETENMPPAPADHVYQVWLIDTEGPKNAGTMAGSRFAVAADRSDYQALAITVEPAPLGSEGPTTEPFFVAPLDSTGT